MSKRETIEQPVFAAIKNWARREGKKTGKFDNRQHATRRIAAFCEQRENGDRSLSDKDEIRRLWAVCRMQPNDLTCILQASRPHDSERRHSRAFVCRTAQSAAFVRVARFAARSAGRLLLLFGRRRHRRRCHRAAEIALDGAASQQPVRGREREAQAPASTAAASATRKEQQKNLVMSVIRADWRPSPPPNDRRDRRAYVLNAQSAPSRCTQIAEAKDSQIAEAKDSKLVDSRAPKSSLALVKWRQSPLRL